MLLRTNPAGHCRQRVVVEQCLRRAAKVAIFDLAHEGGDVDCHGAALDTCGVFAGEAALRFEEGDVFGETQIDLVEGPRAGGCIPGRHRLTGGVYRCREHRVGGIAVEVDVGRHDGKESLVR